MIIHTKYTGTWRQNDFNVYAYLGAMEILLGPLVGSLSDTLGRKWIIVFGRIGGFSPERKYVYRVAGPNCKTWPDTLTENPY